MVFIKACVPQDRQCFKITEMKNRRSGNELKFIGSGMNLFLANNLSSFKNANVKVMISSNVWKTISQCVLIAILFVRVGAPLLGLPKSLYLH